MEIPHKPDLERAAQEEYMTKIAQRDLKANTYYPEKIDELDLTTMERFLRYHPDPSRLMKLGITFAHRDLGSVADAMENHQPWAVVSGLNPSGPLHFGHKLVFDEVKWMQEQGADVYIPFTNDESYLVGKTKTLADSRRIAYERVMPSIIAMGFDQYKTHMFVDSDYPDIYNAAIEVSKHLTLHRLFSVFGLGKDDEGENSGIVFYRGAVQIAQILLPQYKEFGGPKPTLVPVGVDQYPYVLLARDIAKKMGFIPPAALFLKFELGLDGKGKMSTTRPDSSVFLTDELSVAQKKIKTAYTGGSILASFQREHGGVPEICPVGQLRTYHFEQDDKVEQQCRHGLILCGECKGEAITQTLEYLTSHREKIAEAKTRINDFILNTPIRSILE